MNVDNEIWKPVVGYEGLYSVSNFGRVRTEKSHGKNSKPNHIMSPCYHSRGYTQVMLSNPTIGKSKKRFIHRLVAESFIGPCPFKYEVNHLNCVLDYNRVENLQYVTRKENIAHAVLNNRTTFGEKNHFSKLTTEKVVAIRWLASTNKYSHREIGNMYGIRGSHVGKIVDKTAWARV